jgi:sulfite exporter TauE/SafE
MELLIAAFSLGVLGSFHCVGMCGPIALALPVHHLSKPKRILGILIYHLGRALTYSLIGAFFGMLGMGIVLAGYQQALSIALGILLLLSVVLPSTRVNTFFSAPITALTFRLKSAFKSLFTQRSTTALFVTGLLNGLLPCGLVYMALAGATASGDVIKGALFMAVFGLGTLPAMFSVTLLSSISSNFRLQVRKYAPVIAGIMACLLILRGLGLGIPYVSPSMSKQSNEKHECCHAPKSSPQQHAH